LSDAANRVRLNRYPEMRPAIERGSAALAALLEGETGS
jgi:hypothetical protein